MTTNLKLKYYSSEFLRIKRGYRNGRVVNAKPYLLLAIFDLIEQFHIVDNHVLFDEMLKNQYEYIHGTYESSLITSLYKPSYYMASDGFWHIEWKVQSEIKISAKYLKENVKYARFDNALWDLLQDSESRQALREVIIKHFLT